MAINAFSSIVNYLLCLPKLEVDVTMVAALGPRKCFAHEAQQWSQSQMQSEPLKHVSRSRQNDLLLFSKPIQQILEAKIDQMPRFLSQKHGKQCWDKKLIPGLISAEISVDFKWWEKVVTPFRCPFFFSPLSHVNILEQVHFNMSQRKSN